MPKSPKRKLSHSITEHLKGQDRKAIDDEFQEYFDSFPSRIIMKTHKVRGLDIGTSLVYTYDKNT